MTSTLAPVAKKARGYGLSPLPVGSPGWLMELPPDAEGKPQPPLELKKKPTHIVDGKPRLMSWNRYKNERPMTDDEIEAEFPGIEYIGFACGKTSGNLEVVDFDRAGIYDLWVEVLTAIGGGELLAKLAVQNTQREGCKHVLFRCETIEGNQKLARYYDEDDLDDFLQPKVKVSIETRGQGGYIVGFPSPGYTMHQGSFSAIPTISGEERELLIRAARLLDAVVDEVKPQPRAAKPDAGAPGLRPGDDFNRRADWCDILTSSGGRMVLERGERQFWCRPGKTGRDWSATTGNGRSGQDLLKVFTSNWPPFEPEGVYDKFGAWALLNHGGDIHAAASELGRNGYGDRPANPVADRPVAAESVNPVFEPVATEEKPRGFLSKRIRWSELRELPPKPMLVDKFLGVGDSAMIVGIRKGGKTAVVFDLVCAMLRGGTFAGKFEVKRPLTVAYFTTEGTGALGERMRCANVGHGVDDYTLDEHWIYVPELPQCFDESSEFHVLKVVQEFKEAGIRPDVMIHDTFAKSIQGAEENSNSDMSRALSTLQKARVELGCATILLHHINKSGTLRGASAIDGDLDVLLQVEHEEETGDRRLSYGFAKDLGPFDAIPFELDVMDSDVSGSIRVNWTPGRRNAGMTAIERVLQVMQQAPDDLWAIGQLAGLLTDLKTPAIQTALSRESDKGDTARISIIKREDKPLRYRLTQKGRW